MSVFSDRLTCARKSLKLTQQEIAERFSVTRSAYSAWELARNEPSLSFVRNFCRAFGISADYLLGLSDVQHAVPPVSVNSCSVPRNPLDSLDPDLRSKAEGYIDSLREQQADRNAKQKEA